MGMRCPECTSEVIASPFNGLPTCTNCKRIYPLSINSPQLKPLMDDQTLNRSEATLLKEKDKTGDTNSQEIDEEGKPMIPPTPQTSGNVNAVTPDYSQINSNKASYLLGIQDGRAQIINEIKKIIGEGQ